MSDPRTVLERELARVELRPFTLESVRRRRERKRRNQRIAAGVLGGAVAAVIVVVAIGTLSPGSPRDPGTSPSPTPSVVPEPAIRFDSSRYGYSLSHPQGWEATDAAAPWTSGRVDAGVSDLLVDDRTGDVVLEAASIALPEGMTVEDWLDREVRRAARVAGLDGGSFDDGHGLLTTKVDGVPGRFAVACRVVLVVTERRGYVFRVGTDLAIDIELRTVVRSIQLTPDTATDA